MLSTLDFKKVADLFEDSLNGKDARTEDAPEKAFLTALGYLDDAGKPVATKVWSGLSKLLRHADTLDNLFAMPVPTMPGLYFFGAQRRTRPGVLTNYGGSGVAPNEAFERCLGEAVEHITSLSVEPGHHQTRSSSTGFASGKTLAHAQISAANECLERHDLARWFLSGAPLLALQPDKRLISIASSLRRSREPSIEFLLVLNENNPHNTVIAASEYCGELVTGYGCSPDIYDACLKAACELGQGELGVQFERQLPTSPPNGFLARSSHFRSLPHLLEADVSKTPDTLSGQRDSGPFANLGDFTFSDITSEEIGIPCVQAKNTKLRDVVLEVNEGDIGPL
ncbi:YcaO-like family protein [Roseibium sp.]|uniref:YcaO-like family protein n=2 Tax=Roseibium sp. TaxID=1936156 RepID=UPI003BAEA7B6